MTNNVMVIGNPSDSTVVYFLARCAHAGLQPDVLSIREIADEGAWDLTIPEDGSSAIHLRSKTYALGDASAIYCRWTSSRASEDRDTESRRRLLTESLKLWTLTSGAKVVNRADSASHNGSKPLHEGFLADLGFRVPASITSCSGDELSAFCEEHGWAIMKSASGGRDHGLCRFFDPSELLEYEPSLGPLHLQQYVEGRDVRVHVVDKEAISVLIQSSAIAPDYRSSIATSTYFDYELPPNVAGLVRDAASIQRLSFSGWDFKLDARQRLWCLEANPMPAYHFYDVGGRITDALCRLLWPTDALST
jgi:glutathione synthase/RimK-type ligase-like ATP-grasp enzyme